MDLIKSAREVMFVADLTATQIDLIQNIKKLAFLDQDDKALRCVELTSNLYGEYLQAQIAAAKDSSCFLVAVEAYERWGRALIEEWSR